LFFAEMLSTLGTYVSVVALSWLVLLSTGSAAEMGTVALAELGAFVLASMFAPPLADRLGLKLTSVAADVGSALSMGAIALTPRIGVGDRARTVLLAPMAERAGFTMPRVMGAYFSVTRVTQVVGASVGGVLTFAFGAQGAVTVDAVSFLVCGLLVAVLVWPAGAPATERPKPDAKGSYLAAFREGAREAFRDHVVLGLTLVIFGLNVLNQANISVFVPLWISGVLHSAAAGGSVMSAYAIGSVLGSLAFTAWVSRLSRNVAIAVGALLGSVPRPLVLGLSHSLVLVVLVTFVSGLLGASTNPAYGALLYERIPPRFQNRVFGVLAAACTAGLPLGGLLAGALVAGFGLSGGIISTSSLGFVLIAVALVWYRQAGRASAQLRPTDQS
jgi:MFS family permease